MAELGSGLSLDQNLDLEISSTGDLKKTEGEAELAKDLSFNLITELDGILGSVLTPSTEREIRNISREAVLRDERVNSVSADSLQVIENSSGTFKVSLTVVTDEGPEELVFEI